MRVVGYQDILYTPLKEEEICKGWNKMTVTYAIKNMSDIKKAIYTFSRATSKILQEADIDDCYEEFLLYLHNTNDYDMDIACERSSGKKEDIISLESYVYTFLKFVVLRHIKKRTKIEVIEKSEICRTEDNEEFSLFDSIITIDKYEYETVEEENMNDLKTVCSTYEAYRYKYDFDIFEVWFIKLLCIKYQKDNLYKDILEILNIQKSDITKVGGSDLMYKIAKGISLSGIDKSIETLKGFVYSADKIEKVVQLFEK